MKRCLARFLARWPYRRTACWGGVLLLAEGAGMLLGARLAHAPPAVLRWSANLMVLGFAILVLASETAE